MRSRRAQFARRALCTTILSGFLTSQILPVAVAGPSGGVVVGGQGLITQSGLLTQIDQSSHRLIIEWDSFDTSTQETVRFFQPNRDAMALNRVLSGQATQFNGSLFANGNVVIVNGAGIHFGPNSQVDVGGLIASTADISNSNFLSGDLIFDQPGNPDAMVTNAGTITARDAGLAALVAPGVENSGLIRAELGTVVLGAGETHTIDFRGDGLISFALTSPTTTVPRRADGSEADALVTNSGTVEADGGSVVMTASQASRVLDTAINMSGVAQANSVGVRNGRIVLGGGGAGRVRLPGQVRARGTSAGTTGGTVHVTGQEISTESAQIDASGVDGGGTVLVGGAERGQTLEPSGDIGYLNEDDTLTVFLGDNAAAAGNGFMPLASRTTVDAASFFDASSSAGDGGDVVVWGADEVNFHGTISTLGGDNGFVEVSTLGTGIIDGLAHTGHFLVDPGDVCVTTGATGACASGATVIASGTILDRLNNGSTFELNTDNYGMSGTGRVDFVGGFTFTINNDTNTMGTFLIHAADTIDTKQIVINNRGTNGTNFEWYAGTGSTGSQVSSADIIHGPQVLETGGGYVIFDAADDISINDPLDTSGGDVLLIARGGDGGSTISIGDTGSPDDDSIDTTDGAGNAGTVTLVADNFVIDAAATSNPIINAGGTGGLVEFRPFTAGTPINLGTITPNSLSLTDAQIDRIAAETLRFGDANSGDITISTAISPAQATNLSIVTGGNIIDGNATGTDITATGLALQSAGGISPLTTEVSNLAFSNTSGAFSVNNTGDLAVTEVDGLVSSTNTGTTTTLASSGTLSFLTDVTSTGALTADASTIELDGNLTAPGGITGTATVVNVLGSNGGAEIQDAIDIAVAGATINVGEGLFAGGITIDKPLTVLGDGFTNTTMVGVADGTAGMTVVSSGVSIDGFLFNGVGTHVDATGVLVDGSGGALTNVLIGDADADLAGNRFTGLTTGLQVTDGGSTNAIDLEIGRGNMFDTSRDAIVLDGSGVGLTGNTFNDASFDSLSGDYIRLENAAAFLPDSPTVLDARGAIFDGVLGSDLTAAEAIAVEEALVHYLDDQTLGLIRTGSLAVTSGNSIQIAVNVAGLLGGAQTVAVGSGTFGGSVEVWVDELTLVGQGPTTIIDTGDVDPFANNGDINTGFVVGAVDTGAGDPSGTSRVRDVTIEGFTFIEETADGDTTGIELGIRGPGGSSIADGATVTSNFFEPSATTNSLLDAIELVNVGLSRTWDISNNVVLADAVSRHGIFMSDGNLGSGFLSITGNTINATVDGIHIAGNLTDGGSGVDVLIEGNTITAGDDALEFTGLINSGNDDTRNVGTGPQVLVTDNSLVGGGSVDNFSIVTAGLAGTDVLFAITDNQTNGSSGIEAWGGILIGGASADFTNAGNQIAAIGDGVVDGARLIISGNDVTGTGGAGVLFDGTVEEGSFDLAIGGQRTGDRPLVLIGMDDLAAFDDGFRSLSALGELSFEGSNLGPVNLSGNIINGVDDGIRFAEAILGADVFISDETVFGGQQIIGQLDAIEFSGLVGPGSNVNISGNGLILGIADDAIEFNGDVRQAEVNIIENAAILGFDNGVEFEEVVRNSFVTIGGNLAVAGGSHGVVFEELVRDSGVTVDGNFAIVSFGDGIGFEGEIRDTDVDINDNFLIAGLFGDGIEFGDVIRLGSEVTIAENNFIGGGEDGIEFEGAIRSNSEVAIQDNIDIVGFDTGLDFNRVIRNSEVSIDGNVSITGITGDGVAMRRLRTATVGISDNTSIFGGEDGITVERGLARSDFSVTGNTDIAGVDDGLNIGFIRRGSFLVSENGTIEGINGSGMEFERRITDVQDFVVEDNELIVGGEEAVEFDTRAAILRSTLRFTNNAMEAGTDGMLFDGFIGRSTIITEENVITAGENGINLTNYGGGSSFSVEASEVSGMLGGLTVTGSRRGGPQSLLTLGDTSFNGVATAGISVTTRAGGNGITTAFEDGVVTTGFPSLAMSGPNQAIAGNTIANVAFNSVAGGNFIELSNGALFEPGRPTIILGTGASFDGTVIGPNAEQATINWVESRIIDFDDNPTLGQIFFFYLPYLFDSGFGDGPVRTTNIQTPGDWILRPDFFFQILATNPLRDDYGLGTCVFEYSETEGRFLPRCINYAGPVDPSPAIQRTLEGMEELSALQ